MQDIIFEAVISESFLEENDPPLFDIVHREGRGLILGLHTGMAVPAKLQCIGRFNDAVFFKERHEAYDLGTREVLDLVAESLGMTSFSTNYSRLVSDLNRDEASHITPRIDAGDFEGNCGEIVFAAERLTEIFNPSADAVMSLIRSVNPPFVLDMHSAYGTQGPQNREFDIGVLHLESEVSTPVAARFMDILREQNPDLNIKENYPYCPKPENFGGITTMIKKIEQETGIPGFLIELNQDQIGHCSEQQNRYAAILTAATRQLYQEMTAAPEQDVQMAAVNELKQQHLACV